MDSKADRQVQKDKERRIIGQLHLIPEDRSEMFCFSHKLSPFVVGVHATCLLFLVVICVLLIK